MATLIRIRLPNRNEYCKVVRTKQDSVVVLGQNRHIVPTEIYHSKRWMGFIRIPTLDYDGDNQEPTPHFNVSEESRTRHKPKHVSDCIRRLFEEIPHFQLIALILLLAGVGVAGVACYFAWDAGEKAAQSLALLRQFLDSQVIG